MGECFFSPAKINLFLRVVKRRRDGFHELASLFQAIDFGDTIALSFSDQDQYANTGIPISWSGGNLIRRALDLFRCKTGLKFFVNIHLDKKIPVESGLGGGSSNAATMLWALNAINGHPISEEDLRSWSAELGSDVPFFFSSGTAFCRGRGELVESLPPLNLKWQFSLYKPKAGLSTAAVFKALSMEKIVNRNPENLLHQIREGVPCFHNDLEEPAFQIMPALSHLRASLSSPSLAAFMTGSGTAFVKERASLKNEIPFSFLSRLKGKWYSL